IKTVKNVENSSVFHWLDMGAPAEKLLLGFPSYGRTYRLRTGATGLGAPTNGPADAGPYTRTAGFWAYYEVCDFISSASVGWIDEQRVPYATFGSAWVGYDDQRSFSSKVEWMTGRNLGGAHVWTLDMDDFGGSFCSAGSYPLINHLRMSMGEYCFHISVPGHVTAVKLSTAKTVLVKLSYLQSNLYV
uniref:Acidic mammalian chitinase-like n=1 Tax=Hippocampus comes TaxID=109280 RepID=A0A3Q2Y014_HIPCM